MPELPQAKARPRGRSASSPSPRQASSKSTTTIALTSPGGSRPQVVDDTAAYARSLRAGRVAVSEIARKLVATSGKNQGNRSSVATVYRILAEDIDGTQ
ncbi:hypothetical protein ACIQU6_38285 [Streptomyces sp. NPDC090442]|uniref:hypothetical protein n=1 Tax=Streptomyces sp. NPDC090442 TaxID=3365962 RepID=UPI0038204060